MYNEYFEWICPKCKDVCKDPRDFRTTTCHNGHVVILGHSYDDGTMDAYLKE